MGWFEHSHYWRPKTDLNIIKNREGGNQGGLIVEDCTCGAVRTIEFEPGKPPVVRMAREEQPQ